MSVLHLPVTADVLLLYPRQSLKDQIGMWAVRHPERHVEMSCGWSLPEIRTLLRYAGVVLVDATENPARARDGFLRANSQLGPSAVLMYTEKMHDALELFVRVRGSLFLLGPLFDEQWEECFQQLLETKCTAVVSRMPLPQHPRLSASPHRRFRQQAWLANRFRSGFNWPVTDIN